ncbi:MAG: metallophosphoesterase, partial [Myxococcales bacterium]|nr:metallophosphoesterase [Myxococcales bacterium]
QVLGINDFHGNLLPPSGSGGRIQTGPDREKDAVEAGGVEYLATHLARLAATSPNTVIVAAGDLVGASPLISALFHDEPAIEALSLAGLDAAAVGNHEFDEGWAELLRLQRGGCHPKDGCRTAVPFAGADFQYLGANVIVEATGETLFPPTLVRRFGGVRVGFIGLTLEGTPSVTVASGVKGLRFGDE